MLNLDPEQQQAPDADHSATATDTELVNDLIEDELLVEEISIDGMCGVY